jgi:hypothetical protein
LKQRFHFIVELLEFYLGSKNHEIELSGLGRMITRHAVSHPSSFVHQVLFIIVPNVPYQLFTPQKCEQLYGRFCEIVIKLSNSKPGYPTFPKIFDSIKKDKGRLKVLGREVVTANVHHEIHVHRLSDKHSISRMKIHAAEGKKIVIDDRNYDFALPSGLCRLAVTGFAIKAYAAPIHHDPRDAKWTAGIRCWRG